MFKKLASLLFDEEEIIEEPHDEKPDLKQIKTIKESNPDQFDPLLKTVSPLEKTKRSSFENITADEGEPLYEATVLSSQKNEKPNRPFEANFENKKPSLTKDVYEFKPVISPMFGIAESEKEHLRPTFVQTTEVKNDSHLQTVISPYYGAIHKDLKTGPEYSNVVSLEPSHFKAKVAEYVEEPKPVIIENISIENLIQPDPIVDIPVELISETTELEKDEDVTQFSLFEED